MRNLLVMMTAAVAIVACSDSNAPSARQQLTIYDIHAPAGAGPADSIHIVFSYIRAGCDSAVAIDARPTFNSVSFAVTSIPTNRPCTLNPTLAIIESPVVYVVPPPHMLPFTARFDEPGATDSVRVIAAQ